MNIAIITARGGSKGLPGKNTALLGGRPLIGWTIAAALESGCFDRVIVTSDDPAILETARIEGAEVIERPSSLATDTASSFDALMHAVDEVEQEGTRATTVTLLQPTSPLRRAHHIREAFECLLPEVNGVISAVIPDTHPMKAYRLNEDGFMVGLYDSEAPYRPRQTLPDCCYANGAIYIFRRQALKTGKNFPRDGIVPSLMSATDSIDIDTRDDLLRVEHILRAQHVSTP
ncbi:acylneuraminate cytidylyltransferase family protein [Larsenimonas rhizosphaerae]|uniref:Acylneuraminate cytidylyltransferase family protein n=1 Tax=Larsenimonas rhizosphaerae TaxID=2944682 RepID=A0AA41ZHM1_9GAMM|nr:acylneuraminate cytidylyltransferase family protein [Larsenimonas rhizosphaerae]MCX2524851.1 acylneuraminate cytidylyltransferase family protein [Larsenimonas rhizosphaerae]